MYHLSNYEKETIINFNEGEDTASVYTHNQALRAVWSSWPRSGPKIAVCSRSRIGTRPLSITSRKAG